MHVLIVERDKFVRAWWESQNESIGAKLTFVTSLGAARDVIAHHTPKPRCVIADAGSLIFDAQGGDRLVRRLAALGVPVLTYSSSRRWGSLSQIVGDRLAGSLERPFGLTEALQRAFGAAASKGARDSTPRPPTPPAIAASARAS